MSLSDLSDEENSDRFAILSKLRSKLGDEITDILLRVFDVQDCPLTPDFREMTAEVANWTPSIPSHAEDSQTENRVRPDQFLSDNLPKSLALLTAKLRESAHKVSNDDSTLSALLLLAAKGYLSYVSRSDSSRRSHRGEWYTLRLVNVPEHETADASMQQENLLVTPDSREHSDIRTTFGISRDALIYASPPGLLLYGAWRLCLLRGDWSAPSFAQSIKEQLEILRESGRTGETQVPIFCGFGGIHLNENSTNQIVVRKYVGGLQNALFSIPSRFNSDGNDEEGFVVERKSRWTFICPYITDNEKSAKPQDNSALKFDWEEVVNWSKCLTVASVSSELPDSLSPEHLQSPPKFGVVPILRWIANADPLYGASTFHFSEGWFGRNRDATKVTDSTFMLADKLWQIKDTSFQIAVRRIFAALSPQSAWSEAIVDAVIAWEALSGDCKQSVTLMTTAFLAKLIAKENERKAVRDHLKKIYNMRSEVVHGGDPLKRQDKLENYRNAAILVALVSLKKLATEHQELLTEKNRFEKFCLG